MDLLRWECTIPGPEKTNWAGGFFPLTMEFTEEYPSRPPKVRSLRWLQLQLFPPVLIAAPRSLLGRLYPD